jgi:hypothetical protein
MGEIAVPCLSQWELAENLPGVLVREERPMSRKPLTRKESKFYSQEISERRVTERTACEQHLADLWRAYPKGMPR